MLALPTRRISDKHKAFVGKDRRQWQGSPLLAWRKKVQASTRRDRFSFTCGPFTERTGPKDRRS